MEESKMTKGLVIGLLTGGIVGTLVTLLYAPKAGKELRADIIKKKDEIIDDTTEYMQIAKEKASELINDGKKKSETLISEAKKKATSIIEDANKVLNEAKDKAEEKIGNVKDKVSTETDKVRDAFKAGMDAYSEEKKKS